MKLSCAEIARTALGEPAQRAGRELLWRCPNHDDQHPSLAVNPAKNAWICWPCGAKGNAWELAAFLAKCEPSDKPTVTAWLRERGLLGDRNGGAESKIARSYDYTDEAGKVLFQVVRYEPKAFRQRRPDGNGAWVWNLHGVKPVLYRLPEVLKAKSVLVVEGEKDVESARKLGAVATCDAGGAGKWRPEYSEFLRGRRVAIIADADEAGRKHAREVARSILGVAEAVKLVELPSAKDLSEWVEHGGTREGLLAILKTWPELTATFLSERAGNSIGALASEVKPEQVAWLWPGRIPLAKLTLLEGDPGLGKSLLSLDLAARLSKGAAMPDGSLPECGAAGVVVMSAEDGAADTIVPRLIAAGADLRRIRIVPSPCDPPELSITIPASLPEIAGAIKSVSAKLIIVDPLVAFLDGDTNSWRDQDIRRALAPLAQMADKTSLAVVLIRHLSKAPNVNPLYRGGGSIGIIGAARAAFLVATDPDGEGQTILAPSKFNLAPKPNSLAFRIQPVQLNDLGWVPGIAWQGESQHTAASLNWAQSAGQEDADALRDAKDFLSELLADGPMAAKEIQQQARDAGISERTLRRAKVAVHVQSVKSAFSGSQAWEWILPTATKMANTPTKMVNNESLAAFAQPIETRPVESIDSTKMAKEPILATLGEDLATFGKTPNAVSAPETGNQDAQGQTRSVEAIPTAWKTKL